MILRTVFVKLHDEWSSDRGRSSIITHSEKALQAIDGATDVVVGSPADGHSTAAWDLCIQLQFDTIESANEYTKHPAHRSYIDDFLKPKMVVMKAWNFTV